MPASPSNHSSSTYDPTQFHSEFGYLAPTMRFRRKVALTLKGGTLGALAGVVAMFFMVMDRGEERAFTMLSTPVVTAPASPMIAQPAPSGPTPSPRAAPTPAPVVAAPAAPVVAMPMSSKPGAPAHEPRPRVAAAPVPSATPSSAASASLTPAQLAAVNAARIRYVPESLAVPDASGARGVAPVEAAPVDLISQMSLIAVPPAAHAKAAPKPKKKIVRDAQAERTVRQAPIQPGPRSAFAAEAPVPRFLRSIFGL